MSKPGAVTVAALRPVADAVLRPPSISAVMVRAGRARGGSTVAKTTTPVGRRRAPCHW